MDMELLLFYRVAEEPDSSGSTMCTLADDLFPPVLTFYGRFPCFRRVSFYLGTVKYFVCREQKPIR